MGLRLTRGLPVHIRRKDGLGEGFALVPGTVTDVGGRGAFVKTGDGKTNFYYHSQIVTGYKPRVQMGGTLVVPMSALATLPTPRAEGPATPPPPPHERDNQRRPKRRFSHKLTPIGEAFRRARVSKALTQADIAELIGSNASRVCSIELGDNEPTVDEFKAMHRLFGDDMGISQGEYFDFLDRNEIEVFETEEEPPPMTPTKQFPPTTPKAPESPLAAIDMALIEFVTNLQEVVPLPKEPEKRAAWQQAAVVLYGLR